jgi:hypothetical protein
MKNWEIAMIEVPKKSENLRANVRPRDGYVLSVDGRLKQRYETSKEAMTAGEKLKERYPVVQIAIYDAAGETYTAVTAATQEI